MKRRNYGLLDLDQRPNSALAESHQFVHLPAAERLAEYLKKVEFQAPRIPIVNNVDVAFEADATAIKGALARQACRPVRWVEVVRAMANHGVSAVVECGPGKVLTGLTRRIEAGLASHAITDPASLGQTLEALK